MKINKENYYGLIAWNEKNQLGIILETWNVTKEIRAYGGLTIDGKNWVSNNPEFYAFNISDYVMKLFQEKLEQTRGYDANSKKF